MYKWVGKQVYEPLQSLNGHYSIHSVNVSFDETFRVQYCKYDILYV